MNEKKEKKKRIFLVCSSMSSFASRPRPTGGFGQQALRQEWPGQSLTSPYPAEGAKRPVTDSVFLGKLFVHTRTINQHVVLSHDRWLFDFMGNGLTTQILFHSQEKKKAIIIMCERNKM